MANVGGLAVFLYAILGIVGKYINTRLFISNFITQNYSQIDRDSSKENAKKLGSIIHDTSHAGIGFDESTMNIAQ